MPKALLLILAMPIIAFVHLSICITISDKLAKTKFPEYYKEANKLRLMDQKHIVIALVFSLGLTLLSLFLAIAIG